MEKKNVKMRMRATGDFAQTTTDLLVRQLSSGLINLVPERRGFTDTDAISQILEKCFRVHIGLEEFDIESSALRAYLTAASSVPGICRS